MILYVIILVQGFCPLKIKITQFPGGFGVNIIYKITTLENVLTIKKKLIKKLVNVTAALFIESML